MFGSVVELYIVTEAGPLREYLVGPARLEVIAGVMVERFDDVPHLWDTEFA